MHSATVGSVIADVLLLLAVPAWAVLVAGLVLVAARLGDRKAARATRGWPRGGGRGGSRHRAFALTGVNVL